ncbi:hypothetical protein AXG93_1543s1600 [Marchantia polymorpha subsp. ruderalis]|uniref:Uncharacterized protein n=1 Tax=Marchantia polymorpha subsp. ruderalis TaxID=1480154 RepID=A0A176VYS0_MARPO|nr:hypothetical protein AXG93_1543s1600 [Marchantia polymorpha subsp. ruderalis]
MADQSQVIPVELLAQKPTLIAKRTYLLNYVIIRVDHGMPSGYCLGDPGCTQPCYLVDEFTHLVERDFQFPEEVVEQGLEVTPEATAKAAPDMPKGGVPEVEDRSLGETSVALMAKWVRQQLTDLSRQPN